MLMQSEGKKTVQIQLQFIIILGFDVPRNCPIPRLPPDPQHFPQYPPNAGVEGGQVGGGCGLCRGSAGDPAGRQGTNQGWEVGEVASLRRDGAGAAASLCAGPGPLPAPPSAALPPDPRPFPRNPFARIIHKRAHYKMT